MLPNMSGHELEHQVNSSRAKREGKIYEGGLLFEGAAKRSDTDGDLVSAPKIDGRV